MLHQWLVRKPQLPLYTPVAAEQEYDRGAGMRGCKPLEAANYLRKASVCEGQKLGGAKAPLAPPPSPPSSTTLGIDIRGLVYLHSC